MSIHIDFETFSAAGYVWDVLKTQWGCPEGSKKKGFKAVGLEVYARHPSTKVFCLAWDKNLWWPWMPVPPHLRQHVESGGILAAWNSEFEYWIWREVLAARLGWPELRLEQLTDGTPRARAWSVPGKLETCAEVMQLVVKKDKEGERLMKIFSWPRNPTKTNPRLVTSAADSPVEAAKYGQYCLRDVEVETGLARVLPELPEFEKQVWAVDQRINVRGIPVDVEAIEHAAELLRQAERVLNAELNTLTAGEVPKHSVHAKLRAWCNERGAELADMTADTLRDAVKGELTPEVRRAIEIRQSLSAVSTKKVWAFRNRMTRGRIHGQFVYCGADRTGRWAGFGIQPHNFPRGDPDWTPEKTEEFLTDIACRDYHAINAKWGDPLVALKNSLRGLIKAKPGYRFLCGDFSAIEAVVLAVLAGEEWRLDVFRGDGKIYEASASAITGNALSTYEAYKKANPKKHHPDRALGKVAELASGYGGSVGAWLNFGADKFFTPERCEEHREKWESFCQWMRSKGRDEPTLQDYAIKLQVKAWRKASPNIVKFWAGLEDAALAAIYEPGVKFKYRDISYVVEDGTLYCQLPSGRRLAYHQVHIVPGKFGGDAVGYYGYNTNAEKGPLGWVPLNTYGGKLVENTVQAVARDLLANALLKIEAINYDTVLHVHDEACAEMLIGRGTLEEMIEAMLDFPDWAKHYPLRVEGWSGDRFRK